MTQPPLSSLAVADPSSRHVHSRLRHGGLSNGAAAGATAADHDHDHGHEHGHEHEHEHGHGHGHERAAAPIRPTPSLVRASLAARLGLAALVSGLIWAGVAWALMPIAG